MQCILFYLQYTEKAEILVKVRLNNHQKNVHRKNYPRADQYLRPLNHNFNQRAKFALIKRLHNANIQEELPTLRLKKREGFWLLKLKIYIRMV